MKVHRLRRVRLAAAAGAIALAAAVLAVQPASAAKPGGSTSQTQTKWYTVEVGHPIVVPPKGSITVTIHNCNAEDSCDGRSSNQSIASFNIELPSGWAVTPQSLSGWSVDAVDNVLEVRSDGDAVAPGESLTVSLDAAPPSDAEPGTAAIVMVPAKQSNDFSGVGNDFLLTQPDWPEIWVGPLTADFVVGPTAVQRTTASDDAHPMCPVLQLQLEDATGDAVHVAGVEVALHGDDPGTHDVKEPDPMMTVSTADVATPTDLTATTDGTGVAVFGAGTTGDCAGLLAWRSGGPFHLYATVADSDRSTSSGLFFVYDFLTTCTPSGDADVLCATGAGGITGTEKTKVQFSAAVGGGPHALGISVLGASTDAAPQLTCNEDTVAARPELAQVDLTGTGDAMNKTVTLTWSKAVTIKDPNNGTPFWKLCMRAPAPFAGAGPVDVDDDGVTDAYDGLVPVCQAQEEPALPCMELSRVKAQETAVVHLPSTDDWAGDPYFH